MSSDIRCANCRRNDCQKCSFCCCFSAMCGWKQKAQKTMAPCHERDTSPTRAETRTMSSSSLRSSLSRTQRVQWNSDQAFLSGWKSVSCDHVREGGGRFSRRESGPSQGQTWMCKDEVICDSFRVVLNRSATTRFYTGGTSTFVCCACNNDRVGEFCFGPSCVALRHAEKRKLTDAF